MRTSRSIRNALFLALAFLLFPLVDNRISDCFKRIVPNCMDFCRNGLLHREMCQCTFFSFIEHAKYHLTDFDDFCSPDFVLWPELVQIFDVRGVLGCYRPLNFVVLHSHISPLIGKSFWIHDFGRLSAKPTFLSAEQHWCTQDRRTISARITTICKGILNTNAFPLGYARLLEVLFKSTAFDAKASTYRLFAPSPSHSAYVDQHHCRLFPGKQSEPRTATRKGIQRQVQDSGYMVRKTRTTRAGNATTGHTSLSSLPFSEISACTKMFFQQLSNALSMIKIWSSRSREIREERIAWANTPFPRMRPAFEKEES